MNSEELNRWILWALKATKTNRKSDCGICFNVICCLEGTLNYVDTASASVQLKSAFIYWTEWSGDIEYPISVDDQKSPGSQYDYFGGQGSRSSCFWDRSHPYGAARWRLLDFLIGYFTELTASAAHGNQQENSNEQQS